MRRRDPGPPRLYVAVACLVGLALLAGILLSTSWWWLGENLHVLLVLTLLVLVGELRPITITRGDKREQISLSSTFALALVLVGPLALAVTVQAAAGLCTDLRTRRPPEQVLLNACRNVIALCAARGAFALLADAAFLRGSMLTLPDELPAALAAGAVFLVVSSALSGAAAALPDRGRVLPHLLSDARSQLATSGVLLSFAPVAASAVDQTLWLVPLLLLPIAAISKSAQLSAERERVALHDGLTGLPNRTLLRLRMDRALDESQLTGRGFAVLLVDLDHFKEINDTLGHHVGDELIVEVARRIEGNLRPGDTVARLGGDEFAVLAGVDHLKHGMRVADRLLEALEDAFTADGMRLDVQASMGLVLHPEHGADVDTLLQRADVALYAAKAERGSVKVYEPASDDHSPERLVLATELRDGLQADELFLVFQPQVSALSGRVVGLEALVRWQHPRHGLLMPDDFLPAVENTGLIAPLTMAVLDKALSALGEWRAHGHDVSVAVNLSARHLADLDLPRKVEALLRGRRIPPSALVLEVTETVIMTDPARAVAVVGLLRDLGISVAIDDFGTGYSSLAYLRRLQIDELKIDKSFTADLLHDDGDAVIVRSTIEMGHNLGLRVVAEGVEDDDSLALLRGWRCDVVQGYGVSHPLPQVDVLPWLAQRAGDLTSFSDRWIAAALASAPIEAGPAPPQPAPQQRAEEAC